MADTFEEPSTQPWWWVAAAPGLAAIRKLWKPFLLIQTCGLAVVLAYFNVPAFAAVCDQLALVKQATGVWFAVLTMPIAAAVVPEVTKHLTGIDRRWPTRRVRRLLYGCGVFAVTGVKIDLFYTVMGVWPGPQNTPANVAIKVAIDQFVYTPLIGVVWLALAYTFERLDFSPRRLVAELGPGWYQRDVVTLLIPCWAYWIPMTSLMYTLPPSLTFVYGLLASAASATILVAVATRERSAAST